jgi:hypothetical protein
VAVGSEGVENLVAGLGPHERLGPAFHSLIRLRMPASSSVTLRWAEWRTLQLVSSANHRSTTLTTMRWSG